MFGVSIRHKSGVVEISLTFFRLFSQDVAMISVFPFDFPCAGERETLLRRGIGLYLWHLIKKFSCLKFTSTHSAYGLLIFNLTLNYSESESFSSWFVVSGSFGLGASLGFFS